MAIRTYDTLLDSYNSTIPEPIVGRQGDKNGAVTLHVTITDRGTAVDLTGQTVNLIAETARGTAVVADNAGVTLTDAKNGRFDYAIPNALWSEAGKITKAYFSLNDTDGQETTYDLIFIVKKAIDISQEKADDYITVIDGTIRDLKTKADDYIAVIDGTVRDLQSKFDAISATYQAGDFYSKAESDSRFAMLGERLNDELELLIGDVGDDVDGGIQDYMKPSLAETLGSINTNKFNLGFGTDYHYDIASDYNPQKGDYTSAEIADMWRAGLRKSLNLTSLSTKLDAVVFGGDNVDSPDMSVDNTGRSTMLKENKDFANTVFTSTKTPTFILKGNHDCNYYLGNTPDTIITDADLGSIYRQRDALFDEHRLNNLNYFYKDFDNKKVRLIGLDMYDIPETPGTDGKMKFNRFTTSGLQQAQLEWLANDALLTLPDDYVVLIAGHCAPNGTMYSGQSNHNHSVLKAVLESFVSGKTTTISGTDIDMPATVECKFANPGHIAGFLFGHWHRDESVTINGVNYIETRCSLTAGDNMDGAGRMAQFETSNEDAFDIVTIDVTAKKLTMKRVGAGSDNSAISTRTFSYE